MPNFSVANNNNPSDSAIHASSVGEGLHAESTSAEVAAVAAYQLDESTESTGAAVYGQANGGGAALIGKQMNPKSGGSGVYADCQGAGHGVHAECHGTGDGVHAKCHGSGSGVHAECHGTGNGVLAECHDSGNGILAKVIDAESPGAAIRAEHPGKNGVAGFFQGDVIVTGDVSFEGMDCAEEFAVAEGAAAEPGTLMVIGAHSKLEPSAEAYDQKVVGVVSGAGDFQPGIILGRNHTSDSCRQIALVGRAYCKVDTANGAIETGDPLTSSMTAGHAMKACDAHRAFGAVIGKAMAPLTRGRGLVPVLISLQ